MPKHINLRTFPKYYFFVRLKKKCFLSPYTILVISSFSRYLWSKIIISMPFDSSNQLFCHASLVFLHISQICDTLNLSYGRWRRSRIGIKTPNFHHHSHPKALVSGPCFEKSLKVHYILFGKLRTFLSHCKLKATFKKCCYQYLDTFACSHPTTSIACLFQSLRIIMVHEYQPYPIINMINTPLPAWYYTIYIQDVPEKLDQYIFLLFK